MVCVVTSIGKISGRLMVGPRQLGLSQWDIFTEREAQGLESEPGRNGIDQNGHDLGILCAKVSSFITLIPSPEPR